MFLFARKHNIKKGLFFSYSVNKNSKFVISSSGYFTIMTLKFCSTAPEGMGHGFKTCGQQQLLAS